MPTSTKDLETAGSTLHVLSKESGIPLVDAAFAGPPDVLFDGDSMSVEDAFAIARSSGAVFVSGGTETFRVKQFRSSHLDAVLADDETERLVARCAPLEGTTYAVNFRWIAQGLQYSWGWCSSAYGKILDELESAERAAGLKAADSQRERLQRIEEVADRLRGEPTFIQAPPQKRMAVGRLLVSGWYPGAGEGDAEWHAISRAAGPMDLAAGRFMLKHRDDLGEIVEKVRADPTWRAAKTKTARVDAAAAVVREMNGGIGVHLAFANGVARSAEPYWLTDTAIRIDFPGLGSRLSEPSTR